MQTWENWGKLGKSTGQLDGDYHFTYLLGPTLSTIRPCQCFSQGKTIHRPWWWWGRNTDTPVSLTPPSSGLSELISTLEKCPLGLTHRRKWQSIYLWLAHRFTSSASQLESCWYAQPPQREKRKGDLCFGRVLALGLWVLSFFSHTAALFCRLHRKSLRLQGQNRSHFGDPIVIVLCNYLVLSKACGGEVTPSCISQVPRVSGNCSLFRVKGW